MNKNPLLQKQLIYIEKMQACLGRLRRLEQAKKDLGRLKASDNEDISDKYQEMLEINWEIDGCDAEYDQIEEKLLELDITPNSHPNVFKLWNQG